MSSRRVLPAKLSRPLADGLVERERLFARLDAASTARCIWIDAPPGAGKSALVSSWIAARKHACTWYQLDGGDADPATLFHYLRLAALSTSRRKRTALPHLTPEYLPGFEVFVRRFFETFFGELARIPLLVFDNCQEVPTEAPLGTILSSALDALPQSAQLICISREAPPPALARWQADPGFMRLEWEALRLTDEEAQAVVDLGASNDRVEALALNARVRGWVAGLKLLLQREGEARGDSLDDSSPRVLFDYLASEVFERARPALQDFLLRTSLLPTVSVTIARRLTRYDNASEMLARLHRQRLFTDRRNQSGEPVYEYHPLLREFLLDRVHKRFAPAQWAELKRRAAELLEEAGQIDAAVALAREAADWARLARLVVECGPTMFSQGRFTTLEQWLCGLPPERLESGPWLGYWLGACQCFRNPQLGRETLTLAYRAFREGGDTAGAFLSLGQLIGSFIFAWGDPATLDPWIAEFEALLAENDGGIPSPVEAQVLGSCHGILFRRPDHPIVSALVERALVLALTHPDRNQRCAIGTLCVHFLLYRGEYPRAHGFCKELVSNLGDGVTPLFRISLDIVYATLLWSDGEHQAARNLLQAVLLRVDKLGLTLAVVRTNIELAQCAMNQGNLAAAGQALEAGWPAPETWHALDLSAYKMVRASLLALEGHAQEAAPLASAAQKELSDYGSPIFEAYGAMLCGWVLLLAERHADARAQLQSTLEIARRLPSAALRFQALMPLVWSYFQTGEEEAGIACLREALPIGRIQDYKNCFPLWLPHVMSDLLARALAAEIEPEYVKRLIRRRGLLPPEDRLDQETWPWPVRIRSLGEFSVHLNDEALLLPARAPKKPLELLKALVALGGRSVSVGSLTQALWPELMGDAATNAFTVALHRLRKLLGQEAAIVLSEGKLSLDAQRVWVDVWAFERLVNRLDALARHTRAKHEADPNGLAEELLRLYPGHFLGEEDAPWALGSREKLRSKFLRTCTVLSHRLESGERAEEAIVLNRRALELDPLAEPFYQGLIRNFLALGRTAEALDAYRRCREILSVTLGVQPNAATQALYRRIKG